MNSIVITGCSSGFGRMAAKQLALRGDKVFATMRDPDGKNRSAADELRALGKAHDVHVLDLDVTSDASVAETGSAVLDAAGAPDVIINNAGQLFVGLAEAFTADELARQLDVNLVGIHRVCRAFLPAMRQRGSGLIINISSIAGRFAVPFFTVYHASKWAVEGYSLGMRRELASSGIDLVVVEPGPFTTELFPQAPKPADSDGRAQTYPDVAHKTFADIGGAFDELFEDPEVPTDPGLVVDRLVELVDMKPGTRPFRSVVGFDFGVNALNATVEPHDAQLVDAMGIKEFVTLRT